MPSTLLTALGIALHALGGAKLRALLTALGILIGIAAVVVVTALGTGAREMIGGQIDSMGANVVFVFSQNRSPSGASAATVGLTDRDAQALRREASALTAVSVYSGLNAQAVSEYGNAKIGVMGVDLHYFPVRGYSLERGRLWTPSEEEVKAKVCLIGATATLKLFGNLDPIGRWVRIGKHPFLVIGTLTPKGQSPFEDQDDRVLMPIGSWRARVSPTLGDRVQLILANTAGGERTDQSVRQIEAILRQRHRIQEGQKDDFRVRTQDEFRQQQEAIFGILTVLLLSVAGVALFVGGVGVMNIMLVSVTERTREIGIRMAIGARRADIQAQFLTESVLLTLVGGAAGVLLAVGLIEVLRLTLGWTLRLSTDAVLVAFATSATVGLIFGFLPARRAAALDPIESLRHE